MKHIKTWNERCEEHPDHQERIISERMIQERMQEEIDELRQALEEKQEPVAWRSTSHDGKLSNKFACKPTEVNWVEPLYTAPQKKEWVGLPESAFAAMTLQQVSAMKYAELVLKEKNT